MTSTTEHDLVTALRRSDEELSPELRAAIVAKGADIVPSLIDVLDGEDDDSPDGDWAPIHAVDLLVDLKATDAVVPMLEILGETDWEHIIHDRILTRLPELGELVVAPALAMLEDEDDPEFHESLCCVLSLLGVKDQRIFAELCTLFTADPITGAMCLGDYGDPRAISMIEEAIEEFELDPAEDTALLGLDELVHAYKQLEGALPEKLQAHVDALRASAPASTLPA